MMSTKPTFADVQRELRLNGYTLARVHTREFRVCRKGAPEAEAYYTIWLDDALLTAQSMHRRNGKEWTT